MEKNTIKRTAFTLLAFLVAMSSYCQLPQFTLTVTPTAQTCLGNGSLSFSTTGTAPGAVMDYKVYLLPNTVTPIATVTAPTATGLLAGNYLVVATQSLGTQSNTDSENVTIDNGIVNLSYTPQPTLVRCGNDGKITINVTSGNAVSYEIISGPVTFPIQSSNIFNNLSVGLYQIRVYDNCGEAVVVSYQLTAAQPMITVNNVSFPGGPLPTCNTITVNNTFSGNGLNSIFFPVTLQYTVFPPGGGAGIIINRTIAAGTNGTNDAYTNIPFYNNQQYTYNLRITDACGNVFVRNNNIVNQQFTFVANPDDTNCGDNFFELIPNNYVAPYTVNFTAAPAGFNPQTYNPGTAFSSSGLIYGGENNSVPEGNYTVVITDSCGRSMTKSFEVEDPDVAPQVTPLVLGCSPTGSIAIAVPGRTVTAMIMTGAPAAYTGNVPQDVMSFVGPTGFFMENLPLGTYTFTLTDSCGEEHTATAVLEATSSNPNLGVQQRRGCETGFGSIRLEGPEGALTSVIMTQAPSAFGQTLPFNVSANIFSGTGMFYMNSLPAGLYTFATVDQCGVGRTQTVAVEGYQTQVNTVEITPLCGSFWLDLRHISNGNYVQSFFLQKYNTLTGTWGHPGTGAPYAEGSLPTAITAYPLTNNFVNINLAYTGDFRVIKAFHIFSNGTSAAQRCIEVLDTFTFDGRPEITNAYSFPCANSLSEVAIVAVGVAPLTYTIITKDGAPFFVDNGTSNVFDGLENASYLFQVTDNCGNIRGRQFDINALDPIAIEQDGFCEGENSNLQVQLFSFLNYEWWEAGNPNMILSTTNTLNFPAFSSSQAGTYFVSITSDDPLSCMNQELSVEIDANVLPNAGNDITVPAFCNNGNPINLASYLSTPHDAGGVWQDSNGTGQLAGSTLATATLPGGTYQFKYIVTGACNATDEATITIEIKDLPQIPIIAAAAPVCEGSNVQLSATSVAGATYQWTGPDNFSSNVREPLLQNTTMADGGTYSVTITVNGCTSVPSTVDVIINSIPRAGNDNSTALCNDGGTIDLSGYLSGPHDLGGVWGDINATGLLTGNMLATATLPEGTYQFSYTVSSACNLTDEAIITLQVTNVPMAPAVITVAPVCEGTTVQLSAANVTGATYQWTGPNNFTSSLREPVLQNTTIAANGIYSVTVTINGCISMASTVDVNVSPLPRAGNDNALNICNDGAALDLNNYLGTPHDAGGAWTDLNGTGMLIGNMLSLATLPAGNYQFQYTVGSACGLNDDATITLTINNIPQPPTVAALSAICEGENIQLSASPVAGGSYQWTGPAGFTSSLREPIISGAGLASNGPYSVTVTVNGCTSASASVNSTIKPLPQFSISGNTVICEGQSSQLSVVPSNFTGAAQYEWYQDGVLLSSTDSTLPINATGNYEVVVTTDGCPSAPRQVNVTENTNAFEVLLDSACREGAFIIWVTNASGLPGATYTWSGPGGYSSTGPEADITGLSGGEYSVIVQSADGCTVSQPITIDDTNCMIPKGISPNGDGRNDSFDLSNLDVKEIQIFNRYGLQVYEKKNYRDEWHGQSSKGDLPTATYYYVITFANKKVTGWVYLQREIN
ncbi:MAG: gliding motility-associated C-terminal domain-containing protein [Flavobacterium sp.]|nr:MAG: gliding motility-associated C-terminal domain-containing protein [Flavobacterium sp.]